MRWTVIAFLASLLIGSAQSAFAQADAERPRPVRPIEYDLRQQLEVGINPDWTAYATGFFFYDSYHIFTNAHAVAGCRKITLEGPGLTGVRATLLGFDARKDMAILRSDLPSRSYLDLSVQSYLSHAHQVQVLSLPPSGSIGADEMAEAPEIDRRLYRLGPDPDLRPGLAALSGEVYFGQSGSPVIDHFGNVVGLVIGKQTDTGKGVIVSSRALNQFANYHGLHRYPYIYRSAPVAPDDGGAEERRATAAVISVVCQ